MGAVPGPELCAVDLVTGWTGRLCSGHTHWVSGALGCLWVQMAVTCPWEGVGEVPRGQRLGGGQSSVPTGSSPWKVS